jgi:hypothetical protein
MIGPALSSSPALLQLTEAIHSCSDDAAIDKVRAAVSARVAIPLPVQPSRTCRLLAQRGIATLP